MPRVAGRIPGLVPGTCDWIVALTAQEQRRLQLRFLDELATLHRAPFEDAGVCGLLRDSSSLAAEVAWWRDFAEWGCAGHEPGPLVDLFDGCAALLPSSDPPRSVLWGDVRLGNVIVDDDLAPAAVLDWEMATIGPAESDLAWFTALSAMVERFFSAPVPGFLDRDGIVAVHEAALGREMQDLWWHELFAMARSAAAGHRATVVEATMTGSAIPSPASSPVVNYTSRRIARAR